MTGEAIEEAANRVEQLVAAQGGPEITSSEIGGYVLAELKDLDKVGYLRFASVYQEIQDPKEFLTILRPWLVLQASLTSRAADLNVARVR